MKAETTEWSYSFRSPCSSICDACATSAHL